MSFVSAVTLTPRSTTRMGATSALQIYSTAGTLYSSSDILCGRYGIVQIYSTAGMV